MSLEGDKGPGRVLVDKVQVQQVVFNLVRNAMEAMENVDRPHLLIAIAKSYEVSVVDTGSGLAPTMADQLFQPFVSTKGSNGMGVGLSISRTIIDSHGGRIWVEDNPGGGTVFRFTLPFAGTEGDQPNVDRSALARH